VDYNIKDQLLIGYSPLVRHWRKKKANNTIHYSFTDFKNL